MLTSIAKRGATLLRGIADALDPKPVVGNDYSIHIKDLVVDDVFEKLGELQSRQIRGS